MRKALKTLRYATELFASLYPEESTRQFIKETRSLQEVFGYLNDVVAARAARRHLPRRLRRQPRGPARRRLRPRLAQRAGRACLEGRPQGLAETQGAAAVLGVRTANLTWRF